MIIFIQLNTDNAIQTTINLPWTNRKEDFLMPTNSRLQSSPSLPPIFSSEMWKIKAMLSVQRAEFRGFSMFSFLSKNVLVLDILSINIFFPKTCAVCSK